MKTISSNIPKIIIPILLLTLIFQVGVYWFSIPKVAEFPSYLPKRSDQICQLNRKILGEKINLYQWSFPVALSGINISENSFPEELIPFLKKFGCPEGGEFLIFNWEKRLSKPSPRGRMRVLFFPGLSCSKHP